MVLVARTALGTINHSLLSLEALRARGIAVLGVVFSGEANPASEDADGPLRRRCAISAACPISIR